MIVITYLAAILFSSAGMLLLDYKRKLAFFYNARRTITVLAICTGVFIIWDTLGIALGIFFSGRAAYMTGLYIAPEMPLEELFFLSFLCYFTLVIYRLLEQLWQRT